MIKKIKQFVTFICLGVLLIGPSVKVVAAESTDIPQPPSAPTAPTPPPEPTPPAKPSAPTPPPAPTLQEITNPTPTPTPQSDNTQTPPPGNNQPASSPEPTNSSTTHLNGQNANGNVGDTTIRTGTATNTATTTTVGNNNIAIDPGASGGNQVINSGNGEGSTNSATINTSTNNQTSQDNQANVTNNTTESTITGQNSASQNVGNSFISTGDANTTGTAITAVNTNTTGLSVAEFNVADTQRGDLVLDFSKNCISGCQTEATASASNTNNGAGSNNSATSNNTSNNNTLQTNDATIGNTLTLAADSGNNLTNQNTGGDSVIQTGNANVAANALTLANNNLAGNILYGVVNIFGKLIGDIILPNPTCDSCSSSQTAANIGNGTNSTNNSSVTQTANDTTFQNNTGSINNNLDLSAISGDNQTSRNTGGDSSIKTGQADVKAQTINVANSNVDGGNMWLVIVNKMGQWVGQILGAPAGSNMAGSSGTLVSVSPTGEITATNSGNGANSTNNAGVSQTTNNTTIQNNNANISNNLNLSANTGGNKTNDNTGGASYIHTGDAQIIANLVNFVNNNIRNNNKLIVTVVNVFGSWIGDFVTPGSHKETQTANNITPTNSPSPSAPPQNQSSNQSANQVATTDPPAVPSQPTPNITAPSSLPLFNQTLSQNGPQTFVAGIKFENSSGTAPLIKTEKPENQNSRKVIKLNLAWLLMLLPFGGIGAMIRWRRS